MIMPACNVALEIQESGDDVLVHDRDSRKIHVLNRTAAAVLRACDGQTAIDEVIRRLDAPHPDAARRDIVRVLADFASLGLLSA